MELCSQLADVAVSPCVVGDCIHRKNVISKSYVVPNEQVQQAMTDFISAIANANLDTTTLPFFIMNTLENGWLKIKFYISIKQSCPHVPANMHFDSYFCVDNMVSLCVSNNPEQNMSAAYVQLYSFLEMNSFQAITPIFQVLGGDKDVQYTLLKVGYKVHM